MGDAPKKGDWQDLIASVIRVRRDRLERNAKTGLWNSSSETPYYVAGLKPTAKFATTAVRGMGGREALLVRQDLQVGFTPLSDIAGDPELSAASDLSA